MAAACVYDVYFALVAVLCLSSFVHSYCSYGSVRLYNTHSNAGSPNDTAAGAVQLCYYGTWYRVCDYQWDCADANVVCKQLGFYKAVSAQRYVGYRYGYWSNYRRYYYTCSGDESTLQNCPSYYSYYNCYYYSYSNAAGAICVDVENHEHCSIDGSVRLAGSNRTNEGILEFCYNGRWSHFCTLDNVEASVACRQLGHQPIARQLRNHNFSLGNEWTNTYSLFDNISCSGYEASLASCDIDSSNAYCAQTCTSPVAIQCYNGTSQCDNGSIRLANGSIAQEGRLEICMSGIWGSVCSQYWNKIDAFVVCRQLGYVDSEPTIFTNGEYGEGEGPILYSDVNCQGWESRFSECRRLAYPHSSCNGHSAGMICTDGCTEGDVRLVGGSDGTEGTVEICHNKLWGLITDAGWDRADAEVVCRQLRLPTIGAKAITGSRFGRPDRAIHYSYVLCHGGEIALSQCEKEVHTLRRGRLIYSNAQMAGVQCSPVTTSYGLCSNVSARLTGPTECQSGNVQQDAEERLRYCYMGRWSVLCIMTHREAIVACHQLGHAHMPRGLIMEKTNSRSWSNNSLIQNITCSGSESSFDNCTVHNGSCHCDTVIGLKCFEPTGCTEGNVRLTNGTILNEGRLEVCVNGIWSSVCGDNWDGTDAHVVCKQLGLAELEPVTYVGAMFGESTGPIAYSNVRCGGRERSLVECRKTEYLDTSCPTDRIAGVLCTDGCTNGEIRLSGGYSALSGNVEVCVDQLWSLISLQDWDIDDATVVCRQLGYNKGFVSSYTKPKRPIFISGVSCHGVEPSLVNCAKTIYTLEKAKSLTLTTSTVAGVSCSMSVPHNSRVSHSMQLQPSTVPHNGTVSHSMQLQPSTVPHNGTVSHSMQLQPSTVQSTISAHASASNTQGLSSGGGSMFGVATFVLVCVAVVIGIIIGIVVLVVLGGRHLKSKRAQDHLLPLVSSYQSQECPRQQQQQYSKLLDSEESLEDEPTTNIQLPALQFDDTALMEETNA